MTTLIQPDALKGPEPWPWSPGAGVDVWAMFVACMRGDLDAVRALVARDPSLVRAHYEYRTPLSFAVRENRLEVAAYLLDHGANQILLGDALEMARDRGYTEMAALLERDLARHGADARGEAVAAAIRAYDRAEVRRLLDASPELLHAGDGRGNQPIHWAVMTRQLDLIDELLARGADVDAARTDHARPIQLTNGDYFHRGWRDVPDHVTTTPDDVYRHLVARGATVDIGMAAAKGDLARVRALVDADPKIVSRVDAYWSGYSGAGAPLTNAAAGGHLEIVKLLLAHGADPNLPEEGIAPNGHALYAAVFNGHHEIATLLLEHGANPDAPVESSADAVWIAIRAGDLRMLELLASHGATWEIPFEVREHRTLTYEQIVATGIRRSMSVLAMYDDVDAAAALIDRDPSLADDPDALREAASHAHEAFVRLLLGHRPDLATRVTVSRPRAMAELLFAHGMDPNRPNWLRRRPLHDFADHGDVESAALFLDHGADIHARDAEWRSTPLAWAARSGQARMAELLLRRGARLELPDDPPWATPLAWATRRGHDDVVRLLRDVAAGRPLPARDLAFYEAQARDLVAAYHSADGAPLDTMIDLFQGRRPLLWDRPPLAERTARVRRFVRRRLGDDPAAAPLDTLTLDDARRLVAAVHGFAGWHALAASVSP
ncbi:Ankyrin repeat-containing domain-containing protein [Gemmatirosa kalamazoonensis]|uniref:Ankyrin repeat-containing domain-containing protein n=1 Tax=Gemmatirosa kalamazoonensis TaxID=861299 RepID=W0RHL8_9BACT|nr:ankyrin repeat domain-containing protein [Gemmatirosa kalamazoonensis]AHG88898.1 Ankyrin repeat-containing domain-containing protein [Gemmatirosa kalamazoonensis]